MGLVQLAIGAAPAVLGAGWMLLRRLKGRGGARRDGGSVAVVRRGGSLSTAGLGPDAISFLTYNILADVYAWSHSYCPPEHLEWTGRWRRIAEALAAAGADVVCLQEVDSSKLEEVQAWAAAQGYASAAQEGGGNKPARCVTLWRADRLQLFWADTKRSRALCTALLYLDSSGTTQVVYVANCHLEGKPEKTAERLVQARNVLGSMARHQEAEGLVPVSSCSVVMAGDFNEGPGGGVAHLLHHGWARLPAGGGGGGVSGGASAASLAAAAAADAPGEASQPYFLRDAYTSKPLPYTRRVPRLGSMLDQLWVSSHAHVTHLLHAQNPSDAAGMPNAEAPSDHLPLGAVVVFPAAVPLTDV